MPLYEFENAEGVKTTFYYTVAEYPKIGQVHVDEKGVEWKRIPSVLSGASDTKMDPNNLNDFVNKTANKKGTVGDLWDQSKELSEARAKQSVDGVDPVQQKYFDDYKKQRHGIEHDKAKKKVIDKSDFTITHD